MAWPSWFIPLGLVSKIRICLILQDKVSSVFMLLIQPRLWLSGILEFQNLERKGRQIPLRSQGMWWGWGWSVPSCPVRGPLLHFYLSLFPFYLPEVAYDSYVHLNLKASHLTWDWRLVIIFPSNKDYFVWSAFHPTLESPSSRLTSKTLDIVAGLPPRVICQNVYSLMQGTVDFFTFIL